MSTWADLLADIRTDLKDTGTTPKWSDDTIYLFAKDAIYAYSNDLPLVIYREELTEESGAFALPTNFLAVIAVESSEGVYLDRFEVRPGRRVSQPSSATAYYISRGKIHLNATPADGDTILLSYKAFHDLPITEEEGEETEMSIPVEDEEIIRLFIKAKISEQLRMNQSSLDRFKQGSGNRDDNPLLPEHNELMKEYHYRIAQRLGGMIQLNRRGRFS